MTQLLDSANAKVLRAEETAQALLAEIGAFIDANPTPYRIVGELRNGNEYVFTAFGQLEIPIRFPVLIGEVMYQLRTALDHLLGALVTQNGGTPTDRHQFPIASTSTRFAEAVKRGDIRGVSATAASLIEATQPYQADHPTPALLSLLREWNNADKHRLLVVVGGAAALAHQIVVEEADGDFSVVGMSPPHVKRVTNEGTDVFTIFLGEPHARFRATAGFVSLVAIENVGPLECATVEEVVRKMIGYIRYVFSSFGQEFN
jgi:hypothetical protein